MTPLDAAAAAFYDEMIELDRTRRAEQRAALVAWLDGTGGPVPSAADPAVSFPLEPAAARFLNDMLAHRKRGIRT